MSTLAWLCVAALAGDPSRPEPDGAEGAARWSFTVEPFFWLAGIGGDGSADASPPVDIGEHVSLFGTIDGGFLLAGEARAPENRFNLLADALFLSLADDEGSVQTDTDAWMVELGGGLPLDSDGRIEALVGLRYVDLEFGTDVGGATASAEESWIDPWLGARGRFPLGEGFGFLVRADVGGFGVGSQFTWQALAGLHADLGTRVRVELGYRAIALDFDDGDLEYDALVQGPAIALAFRL